MFILLLWLGPTVHADDTPPRDLDHILATIEKANQAITQVSAQFRQTKSLSLLDKKIRSKGRLLFRKGALRWETQSPERSTMVIDKKGMRVHYPSLKRLEMYPSNPNQAKNAVLPIFGQSTAQIRAHYSISMAKKQPEKHWRLALKPKNKTVRRLVSRIEVDIDTNTHLPAAFAMWDPSGDRVVTRLEGLNLKPKLTGEDFVLSVPKGTRTVKPIGGLPF